MWRQQIIKDLNYINMYSWFFEHKPSLQNYSKITNQCFLSTSDIVICLTCFQYSVTQKCVTRREMTKKLNVYIPRFPKFRISRRLEFVCELPENRSISWLTFKQAFISEVLVSEFQESLLYFSTVFFLSLFFSDTLVCSLWLRGSIFPLFVIEALWWQCNYPTL